VRAMKKICNYFGIFLAWILSIAFVAALVAAPIALTALSAVQPAKVTDFLAEVDVSDIDISAYIPITEENQQMDAAVQDLLASDAAKKLMELYMTDVYSAFGGEPGEALLTVDALMQIVEEHIEDLVRIVQENDLGVGLTAEELGEEIRHVVREEAPSLLAQLPAPQEYASELVGETPQLQTLFTMVVQKEQIEMAVILGLSLLAILIFVCRLPGFRGVRWLATDLYIAAVFLALQTALLAFGTNLIEGLLSEMPFRSLIMQVVATLANSVGIWTVIVAVLAVLLTVVYSLIHKAAQKGEHQEASI